MNRLDLEGKVAVVTGAARGIGAATAERLRLSGAEVSGWDFQIGPDAPRIDDWQQVDVTDPDSIDAALAATEGALGPVDILVNAAGIAGETRPTDEYETEEWLRVISVNLNGLFFVTRRFLPGMKARGYGRIVNISSVAAKEGNPLMSAYSASKAGVLALTKVLGKELAQSGVVVNCVTPGLIATPILGQMTEEAIAISRSKIPMNRLGQPAEVAAMICWLCTDDCSFSTGAAFDISGGRSTY